MSDTDSRIIAELRESRPRRRPPTPRAASSAPVAPTLVQVPPSRAAHPAPAPRELPVVVSDPGEPSAIAGPLRIAQEEPTANLAVRIRRPLDELATSKLTELRQRGVRSSKVELTELLLWELADATPEQLEERLGRYRRHAPR